MMARGPGGRGNQQLGSLSLEGSGDCRGIGIRADQHAYSGERRDGKGDRFCAGSRPGLRSHPQGMNLSMCADDGPIRCDDEETVVEFAGLAVLFGAGEEQRYAQLRGKPGHVRHPGIWLRKNPFRPDAVGEGIARDHEFGCDDPGCAESRGGGHGRFNEPSITREIAWDWREMEERDA